MDKKYNGIWWCPNSNKKVNGTLTIDEDKGIILETDGALAKSDIINGHTTNNSFITLQGCMNIGFSMNGYGSPSKYTANIVYVGKHFDCEENIKFNKFSFTTSNLNDWVWNRSFDFKRDDNEKIFILNYKLPKPIKADINDKYSIEIETTTKLPPNSIVQYEVNIKETTKVNLCSKSKESLRDFLRLEYIFECFMKIATGVSQNRYDVCGFIDGDKIEIYIPQHIAYKEKNILPLHMPFHFHQIKDRWEEIISLWYKMYDTNEDIWNLYFSINNNTRNYIQHSFIFYAQVIESYHRRKFDKEDRRDEKEKIKKTILSCPEEHQNFLEEALRFAHEITFKERLEQLCNGCDIIDIILNIQYKTDQENFIKIIKDNRNYYTHYDESLEKKKIDSLTLHYITVKINILIHYYMLKELAFNSKERFEILKRLDTEIMADQSLKELDRFVENLTVEKINEAEENIND